VYEVKQVMETHEKAKNKFRVKPCFQPQSCEHKVVLGVIAVVRIGYLRLPRWADDVHFAKICPRAKVKSQICECVFNAPACHRPEYKICGCLFNQAAEKKSRRL